MMSKFVKMYVAVTNWMETKKNEVFYKEDGAVDIIAIVILIAIAVALAIVFRESIGNLLTDLFAEVTENATEAVGKY